MKVHVATEVLYERSAPLPYLPQLGQVEITAMLMRMVQ